jgi:hypothetical protein
MFASVGASASLMRAWCSAARCGARGRRKDGRVRMCGSSAAGGAGESAAAAAEEWVDVDGGGMVICRLVVAAQGA